MTRGRKPKPTKIALIDGNPGKRKLNTSEPKPKSPLPACPDYLDPVAKKEWRRVVAELNQLGLLTGLDTWLLAGYCQAYSLWVDAAENIQKFGKLIKTPQGMPQQSPWVSILNRQVEIMVKLASEIGMTPASRTRIKVGGGGEENNNPFAKLA